MHDFYGTRGSGRHILRLVENLIGNFSTLKILFCEGNPAKKSLQGFGPPGE